MYVRWLGNEIHNFLCAVSTSCFRSDTALSPPGEQQSPDVLMTPRYMRVYIQCLRAQYVYLYACTYSVCMLSMYTCMHVHTVFACSVCMLVCVCTYSVYMLSMYVCLYAGVHTVFTCSVCMLVCMCTYVLCLHAQYVCLYACTHCVCMLSTYACMRVHTVFACSVHMLVCVCTYSVCMLSMYACMRVYIQYRYNDIQYIISILVCVLLWCSVQRYPYVGVQLVLQSNLVSEYLEGHTKSVLLIRGTCYQYWLT